MSYYRIYGLNPAGHITFGDHFECRDDAHALEIARGMLLRFPVVEIWQRDRRIGVVSAGGDAGETRPGCSPPTN